MSDKVDFKKTLAPYRATRGRFEIVAIPDMQYLMVDGHGDPNTSPAYRDALESLYPVAYRLKFTSKGDLGRDYVVPPLEGLWWADDMDAFTVARDKSRWHWTMMIMAPDWIDWAMFDATVGRCSGPRVDEVRLEPLSEGRCVQTLHVGPFDAEAEVLARMHDEFIPANHLRMVGRPHEVYLSDPRRVASDKLRVILRQPVASADG